MSHRPLPLALALLLAAGCASDPERGAYPSLAHRAAEGQGFAEPDLPPAPPLAADPALDTQIATLRTRLAEAAAGFARDAAAAERAGTAAGRAAVGSERWLAAQSALAQLDDWRARVSALATEADDLAARRAERFDADYPALIEAREAIRVEAERQTVAINRITALTMAA